MDTTVLVFTVILLAAVALVAFTYAALQQVKGPGRASAFLPTAARASVVCPRTGRITSVRIRAESRADTAGLRVEECERFPGTFPHCDEACLDEPVASRMSLVH